MFVKMYPSICLLCALSLLHICISFWRSAQGCAPVLHPWTDLAFIALPKGFAIASIYNVDVIPVTFSWNTPVSSLLLKLDTDLAALWNKWIDGSRLQSFLILS